MVLPVEGIVAIVGCGILSLGSCCCWMLTEEKKRKQGGLAGSLCCGEEVPRAPPYPSNLTDSLEMEDGFSEEAERAGRMDAYVRRKRQEAAEHYLRAQPGQPIVKAAPTATPTMEVSTPTPVQPPPRALVLQQAASQYYSQPMPTYQMGLPNASYAGGPVYMIRQ
jgi:hypothetical protein